MKHVLVLTTLAWVLAVLDVLALATITIGSGKNMWLRAFALLLAFLFIPLAWRIVDELPSRPKPIGVEEFRAKYRCTVILHDIPRERVGVYLFLKQNGETEPRYVVVDWDLPLALSLQNARREKKANGGDGAIIFGAKYCPLQLRKKWKSRSSTASGSSEEFVFHPTPVGDGPPKDLSPFYTSPMRMPDQ